MIGQIDPFAPVVPGAVPVPVEPVAPAPKAPKLSPKTIAGVQASFAPPAPVNPAPPKGVTANMSLKPGWGGGS